MSVFFLQFSQWFSFRPNSLAKKVVAILGDAEVLHVQILSLNQNKGFQAKLNFSLGSEEVHEATIFGLCARPSK